MSPIVNKHILQNNSIFFRVILLVLYLLGCISPTAFSQQYNFTSYSIEDGLTQSQVFAMYEGSKGFIWIGTDGGGINCFDGISFHNYSTEQDLVGRVYEYFLKNFAIAEGKGKIKKEKFISILNANQRMILMYWHIGKAILTKQETEGWGEKLTWLRVYQLKDKAVRPNGLTMNFNKVKDGIKNIADPRIYKIANYRLNFVNQKIKDIENSSLISTDKEIEKNKILQLPLYSNAIYDVKVRSQNGTYEWIEIKNLKEEELDKIDFGNEDKNTKVKVKINVNNIFKDRYSKDFTEEIKYGTVGMLQTCIKVYTNKLGTKVVPYTKFENGIWDKEKAKKLGLINSLS